MDIGGSDLFPEINGRGRDMWILFMYSLKYTPWNKTEPITKTTRPSLIAECS